MTGEGNGLPAGTVTFLFTDIEGSTRLLERLGSATYADVLAVHGRCLTDAIERHDGLVVSTEGDAVFAVFGRASNAVAAAYDGQLALSDAAWPHEGGVRVRMGLHTGEADVVNDGYVGMTVHIAARIAAAGHGGQVLFSTTTRALAPEAAAIELGVHRFKDVGEIEIVQLAGERLVTEFPPVRTLTALPNNLPAAVDEFVGREAEIAGIITALEHARLVTLTGTGGSGKTRLALETAATVLSSYAGGVWFIALAVASDSDRVVPIVAETIGLDERPGVPLADSLEEWLRDRDALLVLDNCEHVIPGTAAFADRYLAHCPTLTLLATSREYLSVRGEHAFAVPPLSVSDDPDLTGISDAVELFVARATAAVPTFDADAADMSTVASVCRRLDGLPLAIELAAARLRALSLEQLATRLDDRFRLLSRSDRDDNRGRTLHAVVQWSFDLLTEREQALFARLAVFTGSFGLDAAEQVVSDGGIDEFDVVDLMTRLVEKSLVITTAGPRGMRYRLLETLRQFATAQLREAGEFERWHERLFEWAMARVEAIESALRTPAQDEVLRAAIEDSAVLRTAMEWARQRGDAVAALRIVSAVPLGLTSERRALLVTLLDSVDRDAIDAWHLGFILAALGNLSYELGDWALSSEAMTEAVRAFTSAGAPRHAAWGRYLTAHAAWGQGDLPVVDATIAEAIDDFRSIGDDLGLGYSLWIAALRSSDPAKARELAADADRLLRASGAELGIAHNVEGMGILAYEAGDLASAAVFITEAVELFSNYGNLGCTAHALEAAAVVIGHAVDVERATELVGAADALRRQSGQQHRPWEIRARHGRIEEQIAPLDPDRAEAVLAAGRRLTVSSAALVAVEGLAAVASRRESALDT
jgi:predicted ATPase/class 3 adenylate cyclase